MKIDLIGLMMSRQSSNAVLVRGVNITDEKTEQQNTTSEQGSVNPSPSLASATDADTFFSALSQHEIQVTPIEKLLGTENELINQHTDRSVFRDMSQGETATLKEQLYGIKPGNNLIAEAYTVHDIAKQYQQGTIDMTVGETISPTEQVGLCEKQKAFVTADTSEASPNMPVSQINWRLPFILYLLTWFFVIGAGGWLFAIAVMTILTCHEFGHYIQARRYRVSASLPYFIPLPIGPFGTMGAIIQMDGRIPNRRALFDIGISGPLAGLIPTLIFCMIGMSYSQVGPLVTEQGGIYFGDPLLIQWLSEYYFGKLPPDMVIYSGPLALAGWFGLFLTTLNLFPIGQLDGGHVFYSLLSKRAPALSSLLFFAIIISVVATQSFVWLPMLILLFFMNPRHPPTSDDRVPIGWFRTVLGILTLLFIIIGFTINPIREIPPSPKPPLHFVQKAFDWHE